MKMNSLNIIKNSEDLRHFREVLLFDENVSDVDVLLESVDKHVGLLLAEENNVISQMCDVIISGVQKLHILGHGQPGRVILDGFSLDNDAWDKIASIIRINNDDPGDTFYFGLSEPNARNYVREYINPNQTTDKFFDGEFLNRQLEKENKSEMQTHRSLTGETMNHNEFTHNNMVPFFGAKVTQPTYNQSNYAILDNATGAGSQQIEKREQAPLFKPSDNIQLAHGSPNNSDFIQSRIIPGTVANNVVDIGSEVKSGEFLGKLINTAELEAKFFVGESKFTELGTNDQLKGKKIKIRWKKSKFNKIYEAQLTRVDSVVSEDLAGLNMYAQIDNIRDNDPIRPGVFIEVLLEGNPIDGAIKVPENAVYEERYVYFLVDNSAVKVEIRVEGYVDNKLILSGDFDQGDKIILTRLDNFQNTGSYYSKNN